MVWFDIPTIDIERAKRFYTDVLAVELLHDNNADGTSIYSFPHGDAKNPFGCIYQLKDSDRQPSDHGVVIYFSVEGRLEDALKHVTELGGRIAIDREPIGSYGYRAVIIDSEGNRIALHSSK